MIKEQLQKALKAWEVAREKVALQRDALGSVLTKHHVAIESWQLRLDHPMLRLDGYTYQTTLHMTGNTDVVDEVALLAAIEEMHARREAYLVLEKEIVERQR